MKEQKDDIIEHLEERPPIQDFKTKIENIYHDLPVSIQDEYKNRLRKRHLENDFETQLISESKSQTIAGKTEDCFNGVLSFLQKKKVTFKGK